MRPLAAFIALTLSFASTNAYAQATFANLRLEGLPTVYVIERTGQETRGTLLTLTDSTIAIDVDGTTRTFTPDQLSLIEKRGDSLKNGTIIGFVTGGLLSILPAGLADCSGGTAGCAGQRVLMWAIGTAFYTAVGAGIDAAIPGRTRIWPATTKTTQKNGLIFSASPHRAFVGWSIRP
jgi:hypothetical protein